MAAQASATEPTWAIEVSPTSPCATDPEFLERLDASVPEQQRAHAAGAELLARVEVGRDHSASVSVFDQEMGREAGRRQITLPSDSCAAAGEALALVISVMVEAGRTWSRTEPAEPQPPPEPPPEPPPPEPPAPEPEPAAPKPAQRYVRPERHAWQGPPAGHDLSLAVGTNGGLLPKWALGATLGWGIRGQRIWPVWISASGWLPQRSNDSRGEFGMAYGTLAICPLHGDAATWRWRLCPGFSAGVMWAAGQSLPDPQKKVSPLTMASLAGAVHVKLTGPLELLFEARLEAPLGRLRFVYYRSDGATPQIHETKAVVGSFFGGLALRFR